MIDYQTRTDLKQFLTNNKHIVGDWEFSKTERFCNKNGIDFKTIMLEAIEWEQTYGNGRNLDDNSLIYTVL